MWGISVSRVVGASHLPSFSCGIVLTLNKEARQWCFAGSTPYKQNVRADDTAQVDFHHLANPCMHLGLNSDHEPYW